MKSNTPVSRKMSERPELLRAKVIYGIWFGMALGFSFAIFAWGIDAYQLAQFHGLYPWLKFPLGVLLCTIIGAVAGWLSARLDKPLLSLLIWAITASVFAWLTINLPLRIVPRLLNVLQPGIKDLLHYNYYEAFSARFGVAFVWIVIFISIAGLLQIPLSEPAIFSTSFFGKIAPMLVTLVIMGVCGGIIDNLSNEPLRTPVYMLNTAVQFMVNNQGKQIDPATSRSMHLGGLRPVGNLITPDYKLIVSGYDQNLENVQVLTRFKDGWSECGFIDGELLSCKQVGKTGSQ